MKEIWVEKYRPKSLDEVVGQEEIVERLKAYAKEGNLPHLLFAGPAGTGKTTCAIALARDMFGENWRQNYYELNSSDERGIETVRTKVKEIARLAPLGGASFKIIFLDAAAKLTADEHAPGRLDDRRGRPVQSVEHDSARGSQEANREGARRGVPPGAGSPRSPPDRVRTLRGRRHTPAAPDGLRPQHPGRVKGATARPNRGDRFPADGGEHRADSDRSVARTLRPHRTGTEQEVIRARRAGPTTHTRLGLSATRRSSSRGPSDPRAPSRQGIRPCTRPRGAR